MKYHRVRPDDAQLVVCNARWTKRAIDWKTDNCIVVPPPVFRDDYIVHDGSHDALVLVNLAEAKGASLFWKLAQQNPDRRFIGVLGAYGIQVVPGVVPPNAEVWENRKDPRAIYREARVILMPSSYESWGRVPIEAAASGIPTIAHGTEGLLESLGPTAIYADRESVDDWQLAIEMLDDPHRYHAASQAASDRCDALDPTPNLIALEKALEDVVASGRYVSSRGRQPYRSGSR